MSKPIKEAEIMAFLSQQCSSALERPRSGGLPLEIALILDGEAEE